MKKKKSLNFQELSNQELDRLLNEADWCDKDLLKEHDSRLQDGRIRTERSFKTSTELEEYFKQRHILRAKKAS